MNQDTRPRPQLHLGQAVHVNAHAAWLPATVTSIAHTRIGITYDANLPVPFIGVVAPWVVRPADGIRLQPVRELRCGDEVVGFDGTSRTVASAGQGCDGWWIICYTNGEYATLPRTAILRVFDRKPLVALDTATNA